MNTETPDPVNTVNTVNTASGAASGSDADFVAVRDGAPTWMDKVAKAADAFDSLPVSPTSLGSRAIDALYDKRKRAAARNSEWAEIEARRDNGSGAYTVFLSEDLTFEHWERQLELEEALVPDPWWYPYARRARDLKACTLATKVHRAVTRARRGWHITDAIDMCSTLPRHIGEQLAWMARHGHTWPGEHNGYATPEEWNTLLLKHARTLTTGGYGAPGVDQWLLDEWYALDRISTRTGDADDVARTEAARDAMVAAEDEAKAAVTESLTWVAENIHLLWD